MSKNNNINSKLSFKPHQIVCLEYQNTCLHGEVVQIIESRQLCWFRPLFMVNSHGDNNNILLREELIDVRFSSDLLWPISLFRPSLDTEYLTFLSLPSKIEQQTPTKSTLSQCVNQFINLVWQANKDKF